MKCFLVIFHEFTQVFLLCLLTLDLEATSMLIMFIPLKNIGGVLPCMIIDKKNSLHMGHF